MHQGFHKPRKHSHKKSHGVLCNGFDKCMYVIALIAPVMTVPQLLDIWVKHTVKGVSLATWGAYAFVSALWLIYGIIHKDKIIILANLLLLFLDSTIVIGILTFH